MHFRGHGGAPHGLLVRTGHLEEGSQVQRQVGGEVQFVLVGVLGLGSVLLELLLLRGGDVLGGAGPDGGLVVDQVAIHLDGLLCKLAELLDFVDDFLFA